MASLPIAMQASKKLSVATASRFFLQPIFAESKRLTMIVLSLLLLAASQGLFLLAIGPLLKTLFGDVDAASAVTISQMFPAHFSRWLGAFGQTILDRSMLVWLAPGMLLLAGLTKASAAYIYQYNLQSLSFIVAAAFRSRIFAASMHIPFEQFSQRSAGAWMSMMMNDVHFLQTRIADVMTSLLRDSVAIISCLVFLAFLHWPSALLLTLLTPFFALVLGRVGGRIAHYAQSWQQALARLAALVLEIRSRFDFVRAQGAEPVEIARFGAQNSQYYRMIRRSLAVRSAFAPLLELTGFVILAGLIVGMRRGYLGHFEPENLIQIFAAMGLLFRPWRSVGEQLAALQETIGALRESVAAAIEVERNSKQQDASGAARSAAPVGARAHKITACECGFAGRVQFAATDVDIVPGRCIAIVGPSGAGKSTFLRTIAGLYAPIRWESDVVPTALAQASGLVSQEPFFFQGSLRDNLFYGLDQVLKERAESQLPQVLGMLDLVSDIDALPHGLATVYKPLGGNFSGGQLQRLVIARMLMREKPVWLLDEATSAVDANAERSVTDQLIRFARLKKAVMFVVTHRLQCLELYDEVWFVESGAIRWRGLHKDLMTNPIYKTFNTQQIDGRSSIV